MKKFILFFCISSICFATLDVTIHKDVGLLTAKHIIQVKAEADYPAKLIAVSVGEHDRLSNNDNILIHLPLGEDPTLAEAILEAIERPTCTSSGLDITVNLGTYLVNDVTSITADASLTKFAKAIVTITGTTIAVEVLTKTDGAYGSPSGTFIANLKEYSVPALGTVLTEIEDFIN